MLWYLCLSNLLSTYFIMNTHIKITLLNFLPTCQRAKDVWHISNFLFLHKKSVAFSQKKRQHVIRRLYHWLESNFCKYTYYDYETYTSGLISTDKSYYISIFIVWTRLDNNIDILQWLYIFQNVRDVFCI